jgi:hypothetical protein
MRLLIEIAAIALAQPRDHRTAPRPTPGTNHEAGGAMKIGSIAGETCRGSRLAACADVVRQLAVIHAV